MKSIVEDKNKLLVLNKTNTKKKIPPHNIIMYLQHTHLYIHTQKLQDSLKEPSNYDLIQ